MIIGEQTEGRYILDGAVWRRAQSMKFAAEKRFKYHLVETGCPYSKSPEFLSQIENLVGKPRPAPSFHNRQSTLVFACYKDSIKGYLLIWS